MEKIYGQENTAGDKQFPKWYKELFEKNKMKSTKHRS